MVTYERILILACVTALAAGALLTTLVVICAHPRLQRAVNERPSRQRARLWLAIRLVPIVVGILSMAGVALAFLRYEPRHTTEQTGAVLLAVAAWTAGLALLAAWRLAYAAWRTAQCHRLVSRLGEPIDLPGFPLRAWRVHMRFPLAAVSGSFRPRLILSSRILDECPRDELLAVLQHELAHVRHRDNLVRAGILAVPDVLGVFARHDILTREWHRAVEEAADDEAVESRDGSRLALAAALVRVGRMATEAPPTWMPALALFDGENLEYRVRRLLDRDARPARGPRRLRMAIVGVPIVVALIWIASGPRPLHAVMEWAVRNLP